jgi:hypothetical protein
MIGIAIDRARVRQRARAVGRTAWRVTKTAAWVAAHFVFVVVGLVVTLAAYVAIIVPDSMWARLAAHSPNALDPAAIRTLALVFGVLGFCALCHCGNELELWWFGLRVGAPPEERP